MPQLDEPSSEGIENTSNASSNVTTSTTAQEQPGCEGSEDVLKHELAEKIEKSEASNVSEGIISETEELSTTPNEEPVAKIANGEDKASASADENKPYFIQMPGVPEEEIFNTPNRNVFKVAFAGDPNVGKTSIIGRFVRGRWRRTQPTIGVGFCWRTVRLSENRSARIHLFDLGGRERSDLICPAHFRRSNGAMFVYDESDLSSLDNIVAWKTEMDKHVHLSNGKSIPCLLLGNKCDIECEEHKARREEIREFAKKNGIRQVIDTSARRNIGIDEAFRTLTDMMIEVYRAQKRGELERSFVVEERIYAKELGSTRKCAC